MSKRNSRRQRKRNKPKGKKKRRNSRAKDKPKTPKIPKTNKDKQSKLEPTNSWDEFYARRKRRDRIFVLFIVALVIGSLVGYFFYINYWPNDSEGMSDDTDQYEPLNGNTNGGGSNQQNGGAQIEWQTYYTGLELAKNTNKPIMIDFYYDDCMYCVKLDEDTYSDSRVISKSKEFVCIKLDLYETKKYNGQQITADYGVSGFPTIVYLDSKANEVHRREGYLPPDQFLEDMNYALTQVF